MKMRYALVSLLVVSFFFGFTGCGAESESNTDNGFFTIEYLANGANGYGPAARDVEKGDIITIPGQDGFYFPGKRFIGWNTSSNGSGIAYAPNDILTAANKNYLLYAQWITIYTITYDINGGIGTVPKVQEVEEGTSITLPDGSGMSKNINPFGGWNVNSSGAGSNYRSGSSFTPARNITLYAMWVAPKINPGEEYREVISGIVKITLMTDEQFILDGTEEYRLYRSNAVNGVYTIVDTITPSVDLILRDTSVNWFSNADLYYKVAAVLDGDEIMSNNGVHICMQDPMVYMDWSFSTLIIAFAGVRLQEESSIYYTEWSVQPTYGNMRYELKPIVTPGNYFLQTASISPSWTNRGFVKIRYSHTNVINVLSSSSFSSSFNKDTWDYFEP